MDGPTSVSDEEVPPDWIRSAEARQITGLSRQQVENLISSGEFPARKNTAGHWRIDPDAVRAYAPGALARKAKRRLNDGQRDSPNKRESPSSVPNRDDRDPVMQELARLHARNHMLEDELAYERQAAENRRRTEAAWDHADRLGERARKAARKARQQHLLEQHALEERIQFLRGPRHLGDLLDEGGGSTS